ncbi:MAG: hypothetical protein AB2A00_14070 [Myxococcota bacterium]
MEPISFKWKRGALSVHPGITGVFAVEGTLLREGMPIRLRGVLGKVGRNKRAEWCFLAPGHGMNGDPLDEHLGEGAAIPDGG